MTAVYAVPGQSLQQWGGDCPPGWIEMDRERPGDEFVASPTGTWLPAPPVIPLSVTALQGLLALNQAGQLTAVEAMFNAEDTPLVHRLAFERAKDWQRASPTVLYMKDRMGWTDDYVDQLFLSAEKII